MAPKPVNQEASSEEEESQNEGSQSYSKLNSKSVKVKQDDGSDSDSDLGTPSDYKLQPISRVSKSSSKRTRHQESQHPDRNHKMPKSGEERYVGSSSNGCIIRLWSDKDEITVLNGWMEFKNNTDMGAFHNFMKGKLETNFSKDQLNSKIKRLRNRFVNAMKKSENGDDPIFSKPHEDKVFELSKRIWGDSIVTKGENGIKDEKEALELEKVELDEKESVKDAMEVDERGFSKSKYPFLSRSFENLSTAMPSLDMSKSGMSFALSRLSSSKAKELNQKWKMLLIEEIQLNHKKLVLMEEQMNMALASDFGE